MQTDLHMKELCTVSVTPTSYIQLGELQSLNFSIVFHCFDIR